MRGRQILYPNIGPDSNRRRSVASSVRPACPMMEQRAQRGAFSLLIPPAAAIIGMYTDWGNLKVVSCVAWLNGPDPAAQRCPVEWARWGRPFLLLALLGGWAAGRMEPCTGLRGAAAQAPA